MRDIKIYLATAGALLTAAHCRKMSQPLTITDLLYVWCKVIAVKSMKKESQLAAEQMSHLSNTDMTLCLIH